MNREDLTGVLDVLPSGIIISGDDNLIVYVNKSALDIMGMSEAKVRGVHFRDIVPYSEGVKEVLFRSPDGSETPVRISIFKLKGNNNLAVLNEISEINALQQQLLHMDRLASLGELTSGIAHEIRNPLAGIKTAAQALLMEMSENDTGIGYLSRIVEEIDRLNKLLINFFEFAKPKKLKLETVSMQKVVEDAVYIIRNANPDIRIFEFYPSGSINVQADYNLVKQVIINILLNAVQVFERTGKIEISIKDGSKDVIVTISDNGPGISKKDLPRIFEPFFTTKTKGIGLGLSISYRIVKLHSGDILVKTSPSGTDFSVRLPKKPVAGV